MRLGTHNSGTGERPANFFAKYFPFIAQCQSKTIEEQCEAGVELFDLRVKEHGNDYYLCHGLARYDMTLGNALNIIDRKAKPLSVVMVTYEGELCDPDDFVGLVRLNFNNLFNVRLGNISVKKPEWRTYYPSPYQPLYEQNYPKLVGWKALLPFPRLWRLFYRKVESDNIVMEDFV